MVLRLVVFVVISSLIGLLSFLMSLVYWTTIKKISLTNILHHPFVTTPSVLAR